MVFALFVCNVNTWLVIFLLCLVGNKIGQLAHSQLTTQGTALCDFQNNIFMERGITQCVLPTSQTSLFPWCQPSPFWWLNRVVLYNFAFCCMLWILFLFCVQNADVSHSDDWIESGREKSPALSYWFSLPTQWSCHSFVSSHHILKFYPAMSTSLHNSLAPTGALCVMMHHFWYAPTVSFSLSPTPQRQSSHS